MHSLKALSFLISVFAGLACASQSAFASKTVFIGHAANFSQVGSSAINPYSNAVSKGIDFALEENAEPLNQKEIKIKVKNFDYGSSEIKALDVAKDITKSKVLATIGFYESGQSLLASPILSKARTPLISPMSSATRLFGKSPYFHPMSFSNKSMGEALAEFAKANFQAKTALVVQASDCAYCTDLGGAFISVAQKLGIKVTQINVLNSISSPDDLKSGIKGKKFDVIVVPNHELTSGKIISYLMTMDLRGPFLGGDGWGNAQGSGFFQFVTDPKFKGYCVGHWHPDLSTETGKQFIEKWKAKYNETPSADSTMAYDSMTLLIQAILHAKELTKDGIQASLDEIKSFSGATGDLIFQGSGKPPQKALVILKSDMKKKTFVPEKFFSVKD